MTTQTSCTDETMYRTAHRSSKRGLLTEVISVMSLLTLFFALLAPAYSEAEAASSSSQKGAVAQSGLRATGTPVGAFGPSRDPSCSCQASFAGLGPMDVAACNFFSSNSCGQSMLLPGDLGSREFEGCECTCYEGEEIVEETVPRDEQDGYFVRGVPDFWQHDWGCTFNGSPNAVGCGPIAMAEILYWYGSSGFPELTDDHEISNVLTPADYESYQDDLAAKGASEPDVVHVWQTLVNGLRSNYLKGHGICGNGVYGLTENGFLTLEDYASDHGVSMDVDAFKINRNNSGFGLSIIKSELESGRPLVMRFNWGEAKKSFFHNSDMPGGGEDIFSGDLSTSGKYNDHYVVVTGYRQTSDGRDILYLNSGWGKSERAKVKFDSESKTGAVEYGFNRTTSLPTSEARLPGTGLPVEWNPAGKWVRLYTIDVLDQAGSDSNCESSLATVQDPQYQPQVDPESENEDIDGNPLGTFDVEVGFSHMKMRSTFTDISGKTQELDLCGQVLDYREVSEPVFSHARLACANAPEQGTLDRESPPANIGGRLEP